MLFYFLHLIVLPMGVRSKKMKRRELMINDWIVVSVADSFFRISHEISKFLGILQRMRVLMARLDREEDMRK